MHDVLASVDAGDHDEVVGRGPLVAGALDDRVVDEGDDLTAGSEVLLEAFRPVASGGPEVSLFTEVMP